MNDDTMKHQPTHRQTGQINLRKKVDHPRCVLADVPDFDGFGSLLAIFAEALTLVRDNANFDENLQIGVDF